MNERIYIKIKLKYTIISKYVIVKLVEIRKSHYIFIYNGSFFIEVRQIKYNTNLRNYKVITITKWRGRGSIEYNSKERKWKWNKQIN